MSGTKFLLDSCFILGFYKQEKEVLEMAQRFNLEIEHCYISPINRLEVLGYHSLTQNDEMGLNGLLSNFKVLPFNFEIENKTIELRKRHKIKLPDAIVLATTLTHRCQLLTLDNGLNNKYLAEIQSLV